MFTKEAIGVDVNKTLCVALTKLLLQTSSGIIRLYWRLHSKIGVLQ